MVPIGNISQPPTKEAYVFGILREAILSCDLQPGEKLVIGRLSKEMGMSSIPIRTAIQRLEAEGLVIIKPHASAAVVPVPPDSITELFTLAAALESIVVRLLAPKIKSTELAELRAIVGAMDQAINHHDGQNWLRLDIKFHTKLAQLSDMTLLADFSRRTQEAWLRFSRYVLVNEEPPRMTGAQEEHQRLIHLLERRDGPSLEDLVVKHYRLSLQAYQTTYHNAFTGDPGV